MGVWTWFLRHASLPATIWDPGVPIDEREALLSARYCNRDAPPVAEMNTHRVWHALHVGLTGTAMHGDAPAYFIVGGDDPTVEIVWSGAMFAHPPSRVRLIADYLDQLEVNDVIARLYRTIEAEDLYVYSFDDWEDGLDMAKSGSFARVFAELRAFYRATADADHALLISRA